MRRINTEDGYRQARHTHSAAHRVRLTSVWRAGLLLAACLARGGSATSTTRWARRVSSNKVALLLVAGKKTNRANELGKQHGQQNRTEAG